MTGTRMESNVSPILSGAAVRWEYAPDHLWTRQWRARARAERWACVTGGSIVQVHDADGYGRYVGFPDVAAAARGVAADGGRSAFVRIRRPRVRAVLVTGVVVRSWSIEVYGREHVRGGSSSYWGSLSLMTDGSSADLPRAGELRWYLEPMLLTDGDPPLIERARPSCGDPVAQGATDHDDALAAPRARSREPIADTLPWVIVALGGERARRMDEAWCARYAAGYRARAIAIGREGSS